MDMVPANSGEPLDQEQVAQYIRHLRDLYDAKQTEAYRELLIPEEQPCTFSLTRLAGLPWDFGKAWAEPPCWQLICHTGIRFHPDLKKEYYFTDEGRLRFLRENVGFCTIIELDGREAFVSWEQDDLLPEDGLDWDLYTCLYDENGDILDGDWHGQA